MALTKTPVDMLEATGTAGSGNFLRGDGTWSNVGVSQISATGTPNSGTFLRGDGSWNAPTSSIIVMTAQATTSGTFKDFTGIPAGVKSITIMFNGVGLSGASNLLIQLGTSSGVVATGYVSTATRAATTVATGNTTTGFYINGGNGVETVSGAMFITNVSGNIWVSSHSLKFATTVTGFGGGDITLGGVLDRVRITSVNGTDTLDTGSVNVFYE